MIPLKVLTSVWTTNFSKLALEHACSRSSAFVFKPGAISKGKLHINTDQLSGLNHNQPQSHLHGRAAAQAEPKHGLALVAVQTDRSSCCLPHLLPSSMKLREPDSFYRSVHIGHIHKYSAVTGEWLLKVGPVREKKKQKKKHRTPHSDLCPKGQSCLANIKHLEQQWKQQSKAAQWEPREQTAGAEMTKLGAASFLFALWNVLCRCNVLYRNTWMLRKYDVEPCKQTGRWFSP